MRRVSTHSPKYVLSSIQVTNFTVDPMHTADGGALRQGIRFIFSVGLEKATRRILPMYSKLHLRMFNAHIDAWHRNVPLEYSRRPNHLQDINTWKMRECNVTGTLIIPAMLHVPKLSHRLKMDSFKYYMKLVGGLRLLGGFRMKPVSRVCEK